jgi:N-acetylgalactosamine-N,N'-diacetylbacillosaminyl-diphospho-undecaprenol 4-alpha-N-acetylgalactosaminyltransferase
MKKIVFFINSLEGGGAERILATMLFSLREDFELTLVLIEKRIVYDIPHDINIVYLNSVWMNYFGLGKFLNIGFLAYKIAKLCAFIKADYCFSLTLRPNLINSLSKQFGNKSVTVLYEVATPSVQYAEKSIASFFIKKMISTIYPRGDVLLANSMGVSNDLKVNFFIEKLIQVVYSPINIDHIINLSNEESELSDGKCVKFVTIGRLDKGKNHEMMINSFSKIKNTDSMLYILGEGELKSDLNILIEKLSLQKRVLLLGFDSNPYKYLRQCDVFLFSSSFEGFPTVVIEALACGLPVISTDCYSGPREMLSNVNDFQRITDNIEVADYGILTPVNNQNCFTEAINVIMENTELIEKYQKGALERARYFSNSDPAYGIKNVLLSYSADHQ